MKNLVLILTSLVVFACQDESKYDAVLKVENHTSNTIQDFKLYAYQGGVDIYTDSVSILEINANESHQSGYQWNISGEGVAYSVLQIRAKLENKRLVISPMVQ